MSEETYVYLLSVFVSAFTLPKIYENNKVIIDKNIGFVRNKIEEASSRFE